MSQDFPKFLLFVDGERKFWSLPEIQAECVAPTNASFKIVGLVLQYDSSVRDITSDEKQSISQIFSEDS